MSWTDKIEKVLGDTGLQSILGKLQAGGLAEHVSSWLDQNRQNLPISSEQLQTALGSQQIRDMAASMGLPIDKLLALLSEHLPKAASTPPDTDASEDETRQN